MRVGLSRLRYELTPHYVQAVVVCVWVVYLDMSVGRRPSLGSVAWAEHTRRSFDQSRERETLTGMKATMP